MGNTLLTGSKPTPEEEAKAARIAAARARKAEEEERLKRRKKRYSLDDDDLFHPSDEHQLDQDGLENSDLFTANPDSPLSPSEAAVHKQRSNTSSHSSKSPPLANEAVGNENENEALAKGSVEPDGGNTTQHGTDGDDRQTEGRVSPHAERRGFREKLTKFARFCTYPAALMVKKKKEPTAADEEENQKKANASKTGDGSAEQPAEGAEAEPVEESMDIHTACREGNLVDVKHMLRARVPFTTPNKQGETPLFLAISNGHTNIVNLLVAAGVDVNSKGPTGESLLFIACDSGHIAITDRLLEAGATPDTSCLFRATQNGTSAIVRMLLDAHVDVSKVNRKGYNCFLIACKAGDIDLAQTLLEGGACIDSKDKSGNTALHQAARAGNLAFVSFLLASGANVEAVNVYGYSPVDIARLKYQDEAFEVLEEARKKQRKKAKQVFLMGLAEPPAVRSSGIGPDGDGGDEKEREKKKRKASKKKKKKKHKEPTPCYLRTVFATSSDFHPSLVDRIFSFYGKT